MPVWAASADEETDTDVLGATMTRSPTPLALIESEPVKLNVCPATP
jgi:hypothetical protein